MTPETAQTDNEERMTVVRRYALAAALGAVLGVAILSGTAVAQTEIGAGACDGPIGAFASEGLPWIIERVIIVGLGLAVAIHAYSGIRKDPEKSRQAREWRNDAALASIGTPILAYALVQLMGIIGITVAECANPVPFF